MMNFLQLQRQPGIDTNREYIFHKQNFVWFSTLHEWITNKFFFLSFILRLYLCYIISLFYYVFLSVLCSLYTTLTYTIIVLKYKHYFSTKITYNKIKNSSTEKKNWEWVQMYWWWERKNTTIIQNIDFVLWIYISSLTSSNELRSFEWTLGSRI